MTPPLQPRAVDLNYVLARLNAERPAFPPGIVARLCVRDRSVWLSRGHDGRVVVSERAAARAATVTITCEEATLIAIATRKKSPAAAYLFWSLDIDGPVTEAIAVGEALQGVQL